MKKAALRKQYLIERQRLSDEEVESRSRQIADLFFDKLSQLVVIPADEGMSITIHTFLPIIRNNEINTWFIVRRLWADFPAVRLLAPVTDFGIGLMRHYVITPETVFADNRFGIPEPVIAQGAGRLELEIPQGKPSYPADSLPSTQIDLVLVPLLAFDQQGQRVGYGGGFYDRFLAECRANCIKIGLSLFDPVASIDDVFEGDISLDYCITSQQIWCFQDCTPT